MTIFQLPGSFRKSATPTVRSVKRRRRTAGQAIIEATVAIGVITVGFLGVVALLARSLSVNRTAADQYLGSFLAAEGIEVVKNLIDANITRGRAWDDGIAPSSGSADYAVDYATPLPVSGGALPADTKQFLGYDSATHRYSYAGGAPTTFTRKVAVSRVSSDEIRVNSLVDWQSRGGSFSVNVEDHFYRWRQ